MLQIKVVDFVDLDPSCRDHHRHTYNKRYTEEIIMFTLAGCPVGLGNELGQSSSLIWSGMVGAVGVKG